MNIGIFNWRDLKNPQGGGAELFLHEQAKFWSKKGHNVKWFTSAVKNSYSDEMIEGIRFLRKGGKLGVYFWAPIYYLKYMRQCDILIDAENGIPFFTPWFSKKKKVLLIHHIHKDVWFKEARFPINWIGYFIEKKLMPMAYKRTPIVTVSPSSKEEIRKLFPNGNISIVYNAISREFKPGKKSKKPEMVFVGRLKKYKSIDTLLKAKSLLDKNIQLNIIGRGDDESRLRNIVKKLKLENVNFLGFVSQKEKIRKLQSAWIAINPSFVEGWSITNIEASACGAPVIGSNVHGVRDSVVDGKTGYLFEYGNEVELADKINKLIKNDKLRKSMSKESLKWSKLFSWEESAKKFLDILIGSCDEK